MGFISELFGSNKGKTTLAADTTPDFPMEFGFKTTWYAIKGETTLSVIEKLGLDIVCESNWEFGLNHVHNSDDVFVSPQINGYVLVIDLIGINHNVDHDEVKSHAKLFNELQYFGSHRIVEYQTWAKFINGSVVRAYSYIGESGEITWNEGSLTCEEIELGFQKFPISMESFEEDNDFPDEDDVVSIAGAWGVDPMFSDGDYDKSTGFICRFKGI